MLGGYQIRAHFLPFWHALYGIRRNVDLTNYWAISDTLFRRLRPQARAAWAPGFNRRVPLQP